jgi:hypothetical protein
MDAYHGAAQNLWLCTWEQRLGTVAPNLMAS